MTFNGYTLDTVAPDLGTPQGSPLSPILSALFTAPLLRLAETWSDADLTLYVDDGCIFVSGPMFHSAAAKIHSARDKMFQWLHTFRLSVDDNKCKMMFFRPHRHNPLRFGKMVSSVALETSPGHVISITLATSLCYLGIFFTPKLDWSIHVKIMATRVLSTIKALGVLGNSIRGFWLLDWRRVFISVILLILTYGSQVWFTDVRQASLIQTLQVAQNEACRKLAGTFHTTPTTALQSLLGIPPIHFRLRLISQTCGN